jgi:N-carbamoyl-L-amino-acid hydrolase
MGVRSEESVWFEHSYIGSRSALGTLAPQVLQMRRTDTHKPLEDHILQAGGDPDAVRRGECYLTKDRVRAFLEVHIEQSPLLVDQKRSVGIVTGIPGNFRFPNIRIVGEYGHVGLHRKFRHDAALAAAEFFTQLDAVWADWDRKQRPMAFTIGRLHTNLKEDALTKVAGECEFSIDVRAYTEPDIQELLEIVQGIVRAIEKSHGVVFELGKKSQAEAAESDPQLLAGLEAAANDVDIPFIRMGSPATHDAAAFCAAGIPIGMIFIRNENGSHNPAEAMEISDFLDATAVLTRWIQRQLA